MYRKRFCISIWLLAAFILWTAAVMNVDVQAIGPEGSTVGFAAMNRYVHSRIGVHLFLYTLTDWLSLIPLIFALCFVLLGLSQWIRRKKLLLVDRSILILGGLYAVTGAAYFFSRNLLSITGRC